MEGGERWSEAAGPHASGTGSFFPLPVRRPDRWHSGLHRADGPRREGAHLYARPPYRGGKGRARRAGGWVRRTAKRTTENSPDALLRGARSNINPIMLTNQQDRFVLCQRGFLDIIAGMKKGRCVNTVPKI